MRGDGSTFLRGRIWWIAYSFRGQSYQESSKSTDEKVARKLLRKRLKQVGRPNFVDPAKEEKWTLADMKQQLVIDYGRKNNRSLATVEYCFKHLESAFSFNRIVDITSVEIQKYADARVKAGAARASVNRELAYLRHGFKLMAQAGMISTVPVIKLFEGETVRKDFIGVADLSALLEKVPDSDARDIIEFLYFSGWRSGEAKALLWSWIDLDANMIRLPAEHSKSKKARALPITGALMDVIERRRNLRRLDCENVFHRDGNRSSRFAKPLKRQRKRSAILNYCRMT